MPRTSSCTIVSVACAPSVFQLSRIRKTRYTECLESFCPDSDEKEKRSRKSSRNKCRMPAHRPELGVRCAQTGQDDSWPSEIFGVIYRVERARAMMTSRGTRLRNVEEMKGSRRCWQTTTGNVRDRQEDADNKSPVERRKRPPEGKVRECQGCRKNRRNFAPANVSSHGCLQTRVPAEIDFIRGGRNRRLLQSG